MDESKEPTVYPRALVYGARHDKSDKWYIGSTTVNLAYRRYSHYAEAHRGEKKGKFYDALLRTEEDEWTWCVHEEFENVTFADLLRHEFKYQMEFDSLGDGGYNKLPAVKMEDAPSRSKAYHKAWREKNRERIQSLNAKWRAANQEYVREFKRRDYAENSEKRKADKRARYAKNRDVYAERAKQARLKNKMAA